MSNEALGNSSGSSLDDLIERLERSPPDKRSQEIEQLGDVSEETRAFLREHFDAARAVELAARRPGQRADPRGRRARDRNAHRRSASPNLLTAPTDTEDGGRGLGRTMSQERTR